METYIHFIEVYFTEERIQLLFVIFLGIISVLLAGIFLFLIKYSFFKGMAIPLLLIGSLQLLAGVNVYNRSHIDKVRAQYYMMHNPQKIKTDELPRMEKVMDSFKIYKWIEIAFIICSFILLIVFYNSPQTFWKGLALGFLIQTCLLLTFDFIAEKRGHNYTTLLQELQIELN
jgi:hypothetical protein